MIKRITATALATLISSTAMAQNNNNVQAGIGYDLGLGLTAKYNQYSFFLGGDGFAADMRIQNFTNSNKSLHFYVDAGLFATTNSGGGVRVPLGMTLYVAKDIQAYVQAVPNVDFGDGTSFNVDGAAGLRFKF